MVTVIPLLEMIGGYAESQSCNEYSVKTQDVRDLNFWEFT